MDEFSSLKREDIPRDYVMPRKRCCIIRVSHATVKLVLRAVWRR